MTVLTLGQRLGTGGYGTVHRTLWRGQPCAAKRILATNSKYDEAKVQNEIAILKQLKHRHIIQFYDTIYEGDQLFIITDLAEKGSLTEAIARRELDWPTKERLAHELARALEYLHAQGILHRDLKSQNVLLTRYTEVKLCDFGLSKVSATATSIPCEGLQGSLRWMAPELLSAQPLYSTKSDVFAYGMVLWEMAADCTQPFQHQPDDATVAMLVEKGGREKIPSVIPPQYRQWIELCWEQYPSNRPEAREVAMVNTILKSQVEPDDDDEEAISVLSVLDSFLYAIGGPGGVEDGAHEAAHEDEPLSETKAVERLRCAANQGHPVAQFNLGVLYYTGRGVDQSHVEAVGWFRKGAEQENALAQFNLGSMYERGEGVALSYSEAAKWFTEAANQGCPDAQYSLGSLLIRAQGNRENFTQAEKWFRKAMDQGHAQAGHALKLVCQAEPGSVQNDVKFAGWSTLMSKLEGSKVRCRLALSGDQVEKASDVIAGAFR